MKYRTKPVNPIEIEAFLFDGTYQTAKQIIAAFGEDNVTWYPQGDEGFLKINKGGMIVRVDAGFFVCRGARGGLFDLDDYQLADQFEPVA